MVIVKENRQIVGYQVIDEDITTEVPLNEKHMMAANLNTYRFVGGKSEEITIRANNFLNAKKVLGCDSKYYQISQQICEQMDKKDSKLTVSVEEHRIKKIPQSKW
jgi:hypothetical protein